MFSVIATHKLGQGQWLIHHYPWIMKSEQHHLWDLSIRITLHEVKYRQARSNIKLSLEIEIILLRKLCVMWPYVSPAIAKCRNAQARQATVKESPWHVLFIKTVITSVSRKYPLGLLAATVLAFRPRWYFNSNMIQWPSLDAYLKSLKGLFHPHHGSSYSWLMQSLPR